MWELGNDAPHGPSQQIATAVAESSSQCVSVRIVRTEEQTGLMMQRFTAYVLRISDFGRTFEILHRYSDFETLHKSILIECPGVSIPPMPPKGVDGSDSAVVAMRKVELEKIMCHMLKTPEIILEKKLLLWTFLELPNPAVVAARFALLPEYRPSLAKTLAKLGDAKYQDDIYRLAHQSMVALLMEGLHQQCQASPESSHWSRLPEARSSVCQLLACTLGVSDAARHDLISQDIVSQLLRMAAREESALADAKVALNVILAREAELFPGLLASFARRGGGMSVLAELASRPSSHEFVVKLLWLAWDSALRISFSQAGAQGLQVLHALLQSKHDTCALLAAVLLCGIISSGDFNGQPEHRQEALQLARKILTPPSRASDPQFAKVLCGPQMALVHLASMLEDPDVAPLILGLLCASKPAPAKISCITGNLAEMVGEQGRASHSEEVRARAAELLLHIQGASSDMRPGLPESPEVREMELESCEGLVDHEESLDSALRSQLEEGLTASQNAMQLNAESVHHMTIKAKQKLQALPTVVHSIENLRNHASFRAVEASRNNLQTLVDSSLSLHTELKTSLLHLQSTSTSMIQNEDYKGKLISIEKRIAEIKEKGNLLEASNARASSSQAKHTASKAAYQAATDRFNQIDAKAKSLDQQKSDQESRAEKLRHKANMPGLDQMKQQIVYKLEQNLARAKELQSLGKRVQQGDVACLGADETREGKIAELSQQLTEMRQQHQQLLQEQAELNFDPQALREEAARLDAEAADLELSASTLMSQRMEAEAAQAEAARVLSRDSAEANAVQEERGQLALQVTAAKQQAQSELASLQPMVREQHSGWLRLLHQQRQIHSGCQMLEAKISEGTGALEREGAARGELVVTVGDLITSLRTFQAFLEGLQGAPMMQEASNIVH